MAATKNSLPQFEADTSKIEVALNNVSKPVPDSYKYGRDAILQLTKVNRTLFTEMEEKNSGNYIVSGIERKTSEYDFEAFSLAVGQALYNQSYQCGNTKENSGIKKGRARELSERTGKEYNKGEIVISLNDLCRYGYGTEPTTQQRETMKNLIETLHSTPVHIDFPNGDTLDASLCVTMARYKRKADGAILYDLILNPIFCNRVVRNFAEFPQDITKRLAEASPKRTAAHLKLLKLLASQDKNKPCYRNIETLLTELNMEETYKAQPSRTEKQLITMFDNMVTIGLLTHYEIERVKARRRDAISKVRFYLNKDFIKNDTEEPEAASEPEQPA
jgi:hypothetical protein